MDFSTAVKTCLSKYATFTGRAARSEYWWFVLFAVIVNAILNVVDSTLFSGMGGQPLSMLFSLAILLPNIGVSIRRLHDLDKSGWWLLLVFLPLIGALVLLYWFVHRGSVGDNQFGPDPVTD